MDRGEFIVVTSTVTLLEVLVQPLRVNKTALIADYCDILRHTPNLMTFDLNPAIAEAAAKLRADSHLRTPDAIQLATAIHGSATFFVTNDTRFPKITALKILTLDDIMKGS